MWEPQNTRNSQKSRWNALISARFTTRACWGQHAPPASALLLPLARHARGETAAGLPVGDDRQRARLQRGAEVVANLVRGGLEENAGVAVGVEIKLQRLQLDAGLLRRVAHENVGKVRVAGHRAE